MIFLRILLANMLSIPTHQRQNIRIVQRNGRKRCLKIPRHYRIIMGRLCNDKEGYRSNKYFWF